VRRLRHAGPDVPYTVVMATPVQALAPATLPTLESGDHLTPEEFGRRYEQRDDLKKAELIFGIVYVQGRVPFHTHGEPHAWLGYHLGSYFVASRGVDGGILSTVRFEDGSEVQPDVLLRYNRSRGGTSHLVDGYVHGPPELAAEVAASSATYDLHEKKELYRRMGVQEYLVWRTEDEAIDWWQLVDEEYVPLAPDEHGVVHSQVFPGLELDIPALLAAIRESRAEDEDSGQ
jgi:Uma2 family endonuclease